MVYIFGALHGVYSTFGVKGRSPVCAVLKRSPCGLSTSPVIRGAVVVMYIYIERMCTYMYI